MLVAAQVRAERFIERLNRSAEFHSAARAIFAYNFQRVLRGKCANFFQIGRRRTMQTRKFFAAEIFSLARKLRSEAGRRFLRFVPVSLGALAASQITLAAAPILNQARIANISTSGASSLTPQVANWQFSIIPTSDVQAIAMVDYAADVLKVCASAPRFLPHFSTFTTASLTAA